MFGFIDATKHWRRAVDNQRQATESWKSATRELQSEIRDLRREVFRLEMEKKIVESRLDRARRCLCFFKSVIVCGEPWTENCERAFREEMSDGEGTER